MGQIASASVKCKVTDKNKEIIKQALCKELGKDVSLWKGNELCFDTKDRVFNIHVTIAEMPDSKGYSLRAWGQLTKKGVSEKNNTISAARRSVCVTLVFFVILIAGTITAPWSWVWWMMAAFVLGGVLTFLLWMRALKGYNTLESPKEEIKEAFNHAFRVFRK